MASVEQDRYYQKLVEKRQELQEVKNYTCGRGPNVVLYGRKLALLDIKGIADKLGK